MESFEPLMPPYSLRRNRSATSRRALEELALSAERRLVTRMQVVIQTLFPLVVLILGVLVFILVTAYFLPLVHLIQNLA